MRMTDIDEICVLAQSIKKGVSIFRIILAAVLVHVV